MTGVTVKYPTRTAIPLIVCFALAATHAIAAPPPAATNATPSPSAIGAATTSPTPDFPATIAAPPTTSPAVAMATSSVTPDPSTTTTPTATNVAPPSRAVPFAVVDQPRLTGYFVGDLLTQRVFLQHDGKPFAPTSLPAIGRVSAWFERRSTKVTTDAASRRWLIVEYQILNAPPKLTNVTLPAWQLTAGKGAAGSPATLQVPAVLINIAPLSLPGSPAQVGTRDLRPDHVSPPIATVPIQRAITLSSVALALTLIAWVAWVVWRNRRATTAQPFASALREMRSLNDRDPSAWQALHRAFDRTAGRVIQSSTLPALFAQAPQLTPARPQIEEFFQRSSALFFGSATASSGAVSEGDRTPTVPSTSAASATPGAASAPAAILTSATATPAATRGYAPTSASLPHPLCAELRRIERRHES